MNRKTQIVDHHSLLAKAEELSLSSPESDELEKLLILLYKVQEVTVHKRAIELLEHGQELLQLLGVILLGGRAHWASDEENEAAVIMLTKILSTDNTRLLSSIICSLGHLKAESVLIHFRPKLWLHCSANVRRSLTVALCDQGFSSEWVNIFCDLISDEDDEVRNWACSGLGNQCEIDTQYIRDCLFERVTDENFDVRSEAILGLARRKDHRVIAPLKLELTSDQVGELVVEAAGELGRSEFLPLLEGLAKWWNLNEDLLEHAIQLCSRK